MLVRAVLADADLLGQRVTELDLDHAVLVALRQDMALLPVTGELVEELTGAPPDFTGAAVPTSDEPFRLVLSPAFSALLAGWSRYGPVGYVEAESHDDGSAEAGSPGGFGYQSAVTWLAGAVAWGPGLDTRFDGPRREWPINAALARLGVEPGERVDLFAEVGLDVRRDNAGWLAHGRRGLSPDYFDDLAAEWEAGQGTGFGSLREFRRPPDSD